MEKELVKIKEISMFKKLGNIFSFKKEVSNIISLEIKNDPVTIKINQLIDMDLLSMVAEVEKNGYQLSVIQKSRFYHKLKSKMDISEMSELKNLLAINYNIDKNFLADYLINGQYGSKLMKAIDESNSQFWLNEEWANKIMETIHQNIDKYHEELTKTGLKYSRKNKIGLDTNYHRKLSDKIFYMIQFFSRQILPRIHHAVSLENHLSLTQAVKHVDKFTHDLIKDFVTNSVKKNKTDTIESLCEAYHHYVFSSVASSIVIYLEDNNKNYFQNEKQKIINQLTDKLPELFLNDLINKEKEESKKLTTETLPITIQKALNQLSEKIKICYQEKETMLSSEWDQLEKLWSVHLVKSLDTYNKMSEKYMQSAQNVENKTADVLLLETITNLDEILEAKLLQINENRMTDLSAIQRQTRELKKSIVKTV